MTEGIAEAQTVPRPPGELALCTRWVTANALAGVMTIIVVMAVYRLSDTEKLSWGPSILFVLIWASILAATQWLVLRLVFRRAGRWLLVTSVGLFVTEMAPIEMFILENAFTTWLRTFDTNGILALALYVLGLTFFGLLLGVGQLQILISPVRSARRRSAVGWLGASALGNGLCGFAPEFIINALGWYADIAVLLWAGAAFGAVYGGLTCVPLNWVLRDKAPPSSPWAGFG